ncbi:DUF1338 domain-containing protein [Paraferrimonas sp. SM1919]|uniref:DUF1338 domain-containing protein n=1 Tax=Paraferrimonas sp. SM1919 TaxID=2662263 RepID=UPI0013D06E64|nr:DUF1338 domain-containing protein [Paraferrimonas sp. SM1919]
MNRDMQGLFEALKHDFYQQMPSAEAIEHLFQAHGPIVNDHIALRTFDLAKVNMMQLARHFIAGGYQVKGEYQFEQRKLNAIHLEHISGNLPKVFISELQIESFSAGFQNLIRELVAEVDEQQVLAENFPYSGRLWDLSYDEYLRLKQESEYGAWVAAFGYRANHFTLDINRLTSMNELQQVNQLLQDNGYQMNSDGGLIKGTAQQLLEQSATVADHVEVIFTDKTCSLPGSFYEFAKRYPMSDGTLYQGFVASSADKIFSSTNS